MTAARRRLGKYELVARIGEGGMAEVHLARQLGPRQFEKLVVVKTVKPTLASRPDVGAMLLEEARLHALVKHVNVVDIYDLGEADGTFFIAMEYLDGEALSAVLGASRAGPRLDPFSTTRIISDCAAGLHAAHELRNMAGDHLELIHQDVTPGNVIVLYSGQVKLVDFGVAKVQNGVQDGLIKGKTGYLAPELLDRSAADRRTDVWSLGVVLWESLTLRRLFAGKTDADVVTRIRSGEIPAPSRLAPAVPRELDDVCLRALSRDPAKRYQTAHDMQMELEQILRHASWSTHAPIAKFMREVFANRISARRELLKELATTRGPRAQTIDQIQAIVEDVEVTVDDIDEDVVGSHGVGSRVSRSIPMPIPVTPTPTPTPAPPRSRRRAAFAAILIAAAALAGVTYAATRGRDREPVAAIAIDAAVETDRGARDVEPPPPIEVTPDAAVEAPVIEPVVEPDDDKRSKRRHRDRDRDRDRDVKPGSGSGSTPGSATETAPPATSAKALYKEGLQKFVGGDTAAAIALFTRARNKDADYAPIYRGLGMAYAKQGKNAKAADAFRTYLKLAPGASDAASVKARMEKLK